MEVYTWGSAINGRRGHGDSVSAGEAKLGKVVRTPRRIESLKNVAVIQVSPGDGHTLCLTGSGRVFVFGSNSEGQLGHGHTMNILSPRLASSGSQRPLHPLETTILLLPVILTNAMGSHQQDSRAKIKDLTLQASENMQSLACSCQFVHLVGTTEEGKGVYELLGACWRRRPLRHNDN